MSFKSFQFTAVAILFILFINFPPITHAQCAPPDPVTKEVICQTAGIIQVQQLVTRMINISVSIAFMALTVWLIWGALKFFITSGGDPKALAQAWSSMTWAFVGLFFLILAYLAIRLISDLTGAHVTEYCLGLPPYCLL